MTDFVIPCDVVARMWPILQLVPAEADAQFRTIRVENGVAMATNRKIIAVELIGGNPGIANIAVDEALAKQCITEAQYGGKLVVTINDMLQFGAAKTTFGYVHNANAAYFSSGISDASRWREVVEKVRTPAPIAKGGMCWNTQQIATLGAASPSGTLVFEENIDLERPVLVRDLRDPNWFGIFAPFLDEEVMFEPATLPGWFA